MPVYVTQQAVNWRNGIAIPKLDMRPAMAFGEIRVMIPPEMTNLVDHDQVITIMQREMARFDDDDYLVCSGDPALIALSSAIAFKANRGRVTLLKWDRHAEEYFPTTLNIGE